MRRAIGIKAREKRGALKKESAPDAINIIVLVKSSFKIKISYQN
jgi:hypothetical protein